SSMQSQFPTEYDLMMRGKRAFVPITNLPPNLSQAISDAVSGHLEAAQGRQAGEETSGFTPYQIVMMPFSELESSGAWMTGISGMMFITGLMPGQKPASDGNLFGGGEPVGIFPLARPDSPFGKLFGKGLLALDEGMPMDEVNKQLYPQSADPSFLADALARKSPTEETPPTDPELTREIEIDAKAMPVGMSAMMSAGKIHESQGKATAEISRALGMPVLLESYSMNMPIAMFVKPGKQPVYKVLIALEKAAYKWSRGENTLRIRPEDWALKRSYEIPESLLAYYKNLLEKQGVLTLDDLAQLANGLTDEQIQNTLSKDEDVNFAVGALGGDFVREGRDILRLYAALTPAQKEALNTESGLPFSQLSDSQWERLRSIITDRLGGLDIAEGSILLKPQSKMEIEEKMLRRTFEIAVQVSGEQETRKTEVRIFIQSRKTITAVRERRRKAEEAAKAAEQNKDKQPNQPAQPPPAETQPAPAK
ncbi:MAG: hypothetical protein NTU88_11255, partial [Armatimonadetes bacterium]|nr:hypothetical protein [Armatimonadota bacterium]